MAMDFFEHQEQARRKTGRLVFMFIAAVLGIIALTYVAVAGIFMVVGQQQGGQGIQPNFWNPMLLLAIGGSVVLVVFCGSMYKVSQLSGGGRVVAESLGGRLLDPGTGDPDERKLMNVVEEMAIASGVPVPPVYLMEQERGINAFAAGFSPEDAVIGVTRGSVELLDRDELQGVIAHEFSHILNGDMRLNIRLIGVLFGILVIGQIGYMVLRSMRHVRVRRSSSSKNNGGGAIIAILAVALALLIIGYFGYFFGGLIKSAVSRQREFLADASAVQFTRDPKGIGGALAKIGGYSFGSSVEHPRASEVSHMFFGQGVSSWLGALGATHPPLGERIRRIDPGWDGEFPDTSQHERRKEKILTQRARLSRGPARQEAMAALSAMQGGAAMAEGVRRHAVEQIGHPTDAHLARSRELLAKIPKAVAEAVQSSFGACAVLYSLLLDEGREVRDEQLRMIKSSSGDAMAEAALKLFGHTAGLDRAVRLPLLDSAMPALHNLTAGQYRDLKTCIQKLIAADRQIDLFEWMLGRLLAHRLDPEMEPGSKRRRGIKYYSLKPVQHDLLVLISTLARYGQRDNASVEHAFEVAVQRLPFEQSPTLLDREACGLKQLDEALSVLDQVGPREKKAVINACAACITADREVTTTETELLRAVTDSLGCPMPPLLPGQALA